MTTPASKIEVPAVSAAGTSNFTIATDANPPARRRLRSRIIFFVTVVLAILLAANGFVGETWNHFLGFAVAPVWELIPLALTLTFVATTFLARRYSGFGLRLAYRLSVIWLGVLNFSFFAACATWIVWGATRWLPFPVEPQVIAEVLFGAGLLASVYGLVNASRLNVTRIHVNLPNLPAAWEGRTAALVTDMHLGSVRRARFTRRVVARLQSLEPMAVFISGDLFDGPEANPGPLIEPWKNLSVPAGIYYVTGNHEEFGDRTSLIGAVERTGIRVLNNEPAEVQGLQVVGVHDEEAGDPSQLRALLRAAALDASRPSILLAHQPSNLAVAEEAGIALQLSGHTHGGQIWPWTKLAARVHGRFNYGLNRFGKMQVYTSSGAGTWGVPMRVGTQCEIVLIQLAKA